MTQERRSSGLLETFKTVLYAVFIALIVRTFAYEPFNIPSKSMVPTLLEGDYLFVSKFSYGYSRYSFPLDLGLVSDRMWFTTPERGDVAVFRKPSDDTKDYIKRIVGLPGDRIQVKGGFLYINDQQVERERVEAFIPDDNDPVTPRFRETMPNGVSYYVLDSDPYGRLDDTGVYTVPEGHYFAMGDNRDNSADSRVPDVGFIPAENLIGRAEVIFFSGKPDIAHFWEVWRWPEVIRFARFGLGL